ncbi:hypothetical protein ACFPES_16165 [Paenibacillus sp. GCM10023248]|uniref:hypothetical protein n=1 Tax=Bacillales TaxID=1385 RepID=UPI0023797C99|nr:MULTISPECIES: hypothetical protein [Bacillales]MDD9268575.1 hypothetical protein [Paenibacillus sp. MAHUQ-63]MDR6879473.1 hypothetical protein [Bacillus sp. 3255]
MTLIWNVIDYVTFPEEANWLNGKHLLDTSQNNVDAIHQVVDEIMNNKQYRLG